MKALARRLGVTRKRLTPFRWFDYLALNPDLRVSGINTRRAARRHYRTIGRHEDRRWYVPWPRTLLRSLTPCDPTDGGWQVAPTALAGPRRSVEVALSRYPTDRWAIAAAQASLDRPPSAGALDAWRAQVDAGVRSRLSVYAHARGLWVPYDPHRLEAVPVEHLSVQEWNDRAEQARAELPAARRVRWSEQRFRSSTVLPTEPSVSVLCSLYRSDAFLDLLLGNIVEQTIFDECEFIMVAVDPSPVERELLDRAASQHPNIRVDVVAERIGLYAAWNRGARAALGRYLTNMNADDLRRADSLERQRTVLDEWPWADAVTPDVLLTLDFHQPWEVVARVGDRTHLPPSTMSSFLSYLNPPHCGPMWRRSLHDRFGWFDERLRSAGDAEFWMRCVRGGAHFVKDRELHVGYYVNPSGISTSPDSLGPAEHVAIVAAHVDLLPSGPAPSDLQPPRPGSPPIARADRVTRAAIDRLMACEPPSIGRRSQTRRIVLDDHAVAVGRAATADVWRTLLGAWSPKRLAADQLELIILDRSDRLTGLGHRTVPFPARGWNSTHPAADRDSLTLACEHLRADLFVSTSHTFPLHTPALLLDPTDGAWMPAAPPTMRESLEMELASALGRIVTGNDPEPLLAAVIDALDAPIERSADADTILTELHQMQLHSQR